jgi:hypothetical protein
MKHKGKEKSDFSLKVHSKRRLELKYSISAGTKTKYQIS